MTGRVSLGMSHNCTRENARWYRWLWPSTQSVSWSCFVYWNRLDRVHSQRGQDESTALNVFSTLETFALLASVMFSHAPILCTCSISFLLSPTCTLPFHAHLKEMIWVKACNYTLSWLYSLIIRNFLNFNLRGYMKVRHIWSGSPSHRLGMKDWGSTSL